LVKQDQPDYRSRAHFIAKCLSSSVMGWVSVNFNILDAFLMTFEAGFGAREPGGARAPTRDAHRKTRNSAALAPKDFDLFANLALCFRLIR